jgi:hypothetical protein
LSFGFLLFSAIFCGWFLLHFAAAGWALSKLKTTFSDEIDMNYVRREDFKPREVREGRRSGATRFADDTLLEEGTVIEAVVADASLTLLPRVRVTDFVDSAGEMKIGENCVIEGRATSATAIRLAGGTTVRACCAPEITTRLSEAPVAGPASELNSPPSPPVDILEIGSHKHLARLGADTWIFKGDLKSKTPVVLRAKLVVLGSFCAGSGSEIFEDLKVTGNLSLGPNSVCHGKIVGGGDITLGAGCRFEGVLHAAGDLHLGENVRGEGLQSVVAYAAKRVLLSPGIVIRGKIASDLEIIALP